MLSHPLFFYTMQLIKFLNCLTWTTSFCVSMQVLYGVGLTDAFCLSTKSKRLIIAGIISESLICNDLQGIMIAWKGKRRS